VARDAGSNKLNIPRTGRIGSIDLPGGITGSVLLFPLDNRQQNRSRQTQTPIKSLYCGPEVERQLVAEEIKVLPKSTG